MNRPEMVIFDAGRTLIDYASMDTLKGVRAFMPYLIKNVRQLSAEEIDRQTGRVFELFETNRKQQFEVPEQTILRLVNDLLGLEFSISLAELERIIRNEDMEKVAVPHARELLDGLNRLGIKTAVISNLDFSGYLLCEALDGLFPGNRFEFVVASSDYGVRKPDSIIFEAGIAKSGLPAGSIWYVGDKIPADVEGSQRAGMVPVLYRHPKNRYGEMPKDVLDIDDLLDLLKHIPD